MAAAFRGSSDTNPKPELSAVTETGQPNSEDIAKIEASHSKEKHSMKTTHEPLLLSILEELREIREAQKYEPIKPQFLWTFVLQLFGVAFAIVFGVFAVFGWKSGNHANDLTTTANDDANNNALLANKIALISLCLTEQSVSIIPIFALLIPTCSLHVIGSVRKILVSHPPTTHVPSHAFFRKTALLTYNLHHYRTSHKAAIFLRHKLAQESL